MIPARWSVAPALSVLGLLGLWVAAGCAPREAPPPPPPVTCNCNCGSGAMGPGGMQPGSREGRQGARRDRRGPPPGAIEACQEKKAGDACSFEFFDDDVEGECIVMPPPGSGRGRPGGPDGQMSPGPDGKGPDGKGPDGKPQPGAKKPGPEQSAAEGAPAADAPLVCRPKERLGRGRKQPAEKPAQ